MENTILILNIILAVLLVGIILLQKSEGGALGIGVSQDSFISSRSAGSVLTKATAIIATLFIITILGVPYAIVTLPIWQIILGFILAILIARIGNIGYHRWLTHNQFTPSLFGRELMLSCMTLSGLTPPGHYVHAHLNHHKYSDIKGDPHNPKEIGFVRFFFGQYETPRPIFMRNYATNKDAVYLTKHYWNLYIVTLIILGIISPWLIVWLAFMFSWSWILTMHLNWNGHKEGKPTNLGWISNIFLGGEDYHNPKLQTRCQIWI